jgi:hypothetical protein
LTTQPGWAFSKVVMSVFEVVALNEPGMAQTVSVLHVAGAVVAAGVTAAGWLAAGAEVGAWVAGTGVAALEQAATRMAAAAMETSFVPLRKRM